MGSVNGALLGPEGTGRRGLWFSHRMCVVWGWGPWGCVVSGFVVLLVVFCVCCGVRVFWASVWCRLGGLVSWWVRGMAGGVWLFFEKCIVDASILVLFAS